MIFLADGYEIMTAIVSERKPLFQCITGVIILVLALVGCALQPARPNPAMAPPAKAVSPTPTLFSPPTPFQGGTLWVAPDLPHGFGDLEKAMELNAYGFELVADAQSASVKIDFAEGELLSTWVYALVAPFPTQTDSITTEELQKLWGGDQGDIPILVGRKTLSALELLLGEAGENVRLAPDGRLVDIAWGLEQAFALVPFEALEPRWKVIEVDGQAPIHNDFDPVSYALKMDIAVSGPQGAALRLREVFEIPPSNYDPDQMTVLVMTGVTAMTRATAWQMNRRGVTFPAEKIGDWLVNADLTHISNEVAFTDDCPLPDPVQEGLKFCSDPSYIELLELIGTDIVELTGNHVRDYGGDALTNTLGMYEDRGWGVFGGGLNLEAAYQPLTLEHNGNRLAFLGCNYAGPKYAWATEKDPGSAPCDESRLFDSISSLKDQGYQVIFTYQWVERATITDDQQAAFQAAVDAGAVIVSGSQAHQPLGMDFYEDGFIHYGLGNLFFDQMQTLGLRSELIDRHIFYGGRHISTEILSALLESYAQPRPMTEAERGVLLESVFDASGW